MHNVDIGFAEKTASPPPRSGVANWDRVRASNPVLVDRLAAGFHKGDPLADRAVAGLGKHGDLDALIASALRGCPSVSRELRDLVEEAAAPPAWYDPDLVDAGGLAWWRFGSLQALTLFQSLIYGYQAPGLSRPLALTGRLMGKTFQRLAETGRWVVEATAPGGMAPGAAGWRETVKVRLIHALVRDWILTKCDWDVAEWGVPINQTYAAETNNVGFFTLPLSVARDFGIRYSQAELEAMAHQWRWIGHVMGADDDLLPASYAWARAFHEVTMSFALEPDDSGRALTRALLHEGYDFERAFPGRSARAAKTVLTLVLAHVFGSVSTRWFPRETSRKLGLVRSPAQYLVPMCRPAVRLREAARAFGLFGTEQTVAAREYRFMLAAMDRSSAVRSPMRADEAA